MLTLEAVKSIISTNSGQHDGTSPVVFISWDNAWCSRLMNLINMTTPHRPFNGYTIHSEKKKKPPSISKGSKVPLVVPVCLFGLAWTDKWPSWMDVPCIKLFSSEWSTASDARHILYMKPGSVYKECGCASGRYSHSSAICQCILIRCANVNQPRCPLCSILWGGKKAMLFNHSVLNVSYETVSKHEGKTNSTLIAFSAARHLFMQVFNRTKDIFADFFRPG